MLGKRQSLASFRAFPIQEKTRTMRRSAKGFTLIEVLVAVTLVALLAAAITPNVVRALRKGRISRAKSDAQAIANAVLAFRIDTGVWPIFLNPGESLALDGTQQTVDVLVSTSNTPIPAGNPNAQVASGWQAQQNVDLLENHLIRNSPGGGGSYRESRDPLELPGWDGPYLDRLAADPWGNPYLINARFLNDISVPDAEFHNVIVVSAGPNRLLETPFGDGVIREVIADSDGDGTADGDDVGYILRGGR